MFNLVHGDEAAETNRAFSANKGLSPFTFAL
jgi:hypothetical protein